MLLKTKLMVEYFIVGAVVATSYCPKSSIIFSFCLRLCLDEWNVSLSHRGIVLIL